MVRRRVRHRPSRPGPANPVLLADMAPPEAAQEGAQGGGSLSRETEHAGGPAGAQRIGVVDAVATGQRGGHQRHHLVAGVGSACCMAQVQVPVNQLGQAKAPRKGRLRGVNLFWVLVRYSQVRKSALPGSPWGDEGGDQSDLSEFGPQQGIGGKRPRLGRLPRSARGSWGGSSFRAIMPIWGRPYASRYLASCSQLPGGPGRPWHPLIDIDIVA